jgi:hypothetical protein
LKHRADEERSPANVQPSFAARLHRHGAHRWIALAVAAVLLGWLWIFAGQARHPEGIKRQWAVIASRLLVVAGGFFVVRLLLFTHEERIPVVLVRARATPSGDGGLRDRIRPVMGLRRRGYEIVSLREVAMFIRQHRYVPGKSLGLVIETRSPEELVEVLTSVGAEGATAVFALPVLRSCEVRREMPDLPEKASLGIVVGKPEAPADLDLAGTEHELRSFADLSSKVFGRRPEYALVEGFPASALRQLLKPTGYTCLLDGTGYNRFGDEDYAVRLVDVSDILAGGRLKGLRVMLRVAMFKGAYAVWPLAAVLRVLCAR